MTEEAKLLLGMKLHDRRYVYFSDSDHDEEQTKVIRVNGGWIYEFGHFLRNSDDEMEWVSTPVFVPHTEDLRKM